MPATPTSSSFRRLLIGGIALVLSIAAASAYFANRPEYSHELAAGEQIREWTFQGAYTGNEELKQKAEDEIARLEASIGSGETSEYSYYVSIANQYDLLGQGKKEYEYLLKALAIDDVSTGLAWENLGNLLARLGAKKSALEAYKKAMQAQPYPQYVTTHLSYLANNFKEDSANIEMSFQEAIVAVGDHAELREIRARWLAEVGRIDEAIVEWQKVKELSPQSAAAIDAQIKSLRSL